MWSSIVPFVLLLQALLAASVPCKTNAECMAKGLPLRKPRIRTPVKKRAPVSLQANCNPPDTPFSISLGPGSYTFTVVGSTGGNNQRQGYSFPSFTGGAASQLTVTYNFTSTHTLYYVVGCPGAEVTGYGSGGGGASFLAIDDLTTPLIVAGGGGGSGTNANGRSVPATYTTAGQAATGVSAQSTPGLGGNSLEGDAGSGGAGFFGNGLPLTATDNTAIGGQALSLGAKGGRGTLGTGNGGRYGGAGGGGNRGAANLDDKGSTGGGGGGSGYTGASGGQAIRGDNGGAPGSSFFDDTNYGFVSAAYQRYTGFFRVGSITYVQN